MYFSFSSSLSPNGDYHTATAAGNGAVYKYDKATEPIGAIAAARVVDAPASQINHSLYFLIHWNAASYHSVQPLRLSHQYV